MNLRVLTLNIRCDMGMDGEFDWCHRCDRVFQLLKDSGADVIALQEVLPQQRDAIEQNMAAYRWLGRGRQFGGGGEQCTIGLAPHLEVKDSGTLWLCEQPEAEGMVGWDACLPRICSWVEVRMLGKSFVVANTHFDHLGERARVKSAEFLVERFGEGRTILMGDFNATPVDTPIELLGRHFQDVLKLESPPTYQQFGMLSDGPRIDYIWTSENFRVTAAEVVPEEHPYCSDHFAIQADLELL